MTRSQPLVRRNDWSSLAVPDPDGYDPTLSVSVVMPAWRPGPALGYVLAALAAQTYPEHLLEVVVVDDGNDEPLDTGPCPPGRTRVVRVEEGWGRASACARGVECSDGDVVLWLDADMLVQREHVAAHLRWHHVVDYAVVLGTKEFVAPDPLWQHTPEEVRALVAAGRDEEVFAGVEREPHDWVEHMWRRTDMLTRAGVRGFRSHVGATGSVGRSLLADAGGMRTDLVLGEDTELGHRLGEQGAVLVPEVLAGSWHLGRSHVMQRRAQVNSFNDPALSHLVPGLRNKRTRGRVYEVPYLEVVLPATGTADEVRACVDALLDQDLGDLVVRLVGPWDQLDHGRRSVLDDPMVDLHVLARGYGPEPRVDLVTEAPAVPVAPFRLELAGPQWAPTRPALLALLEDVERTHHAGRDLVVDPAVPEEVAVRLRSSAALARAARVGARTEAEVADVLTEAYGLAVWPLAESGWVPTGEVEVEHYVGRVEKPRRPARSRETFRRALGEEPGAGVGARARRIFGQR